MDLGTMGKKLKAQEYNNKQQFIDDLNLIYLNCFTYNTADDSIYRQHIQMLRDKWTYLLKSVPDIVIGKAEIIGDKKVQKQYVTGNQVTTNEPQSQSQSQPQAQSQSQARSIAQTQTLKQAKQTKVLIAQSDPLDDLDDLLNAHLDSLSDAESCPSPKKQRNSTPVLHSHLNDLNDKFPGRCAKLMIKYYSDCKAAWGKASRNDNNEIGSSSSFVFPELVYFFNSVPDSHLIKLDNSNNTNTPPSYSSVNTMNRFYDNFRIIQSIRTLRRHILEGSRTEIPNIEHLKSPSKRFDRFGPVFKDVIENSWQAKTVLRKVIALYLAQSGFERTLINI
jgi:hypothetical protein